MSDQSSRPAGWLPPPSELDTRERQLDPFPWFRDQRRERAMRYDDSRGCWEVFRYEPAKEILGDWERFSSRSPLPADRQNIIRDTIFNVDPPRHTELRSTVEDEFRPSVVHGMEPKIRRIADELLDDVADDGEMDFVTDYAQPLPILVIAELLGVPEEDRDEFKAWCDVLTKYQTTTGTDAVEEQDEVSREMGAYFMEIIEERREDPQDDIISVLAQSEIDGEPMPLKDILGFGALFLIAGNITTAHGLTNAMRCFSSQPRLFDDLAGDRDALETAIEEVFRYRSPVPLNRRVVTEDTEVAGNQLREGDLVMVWVISANHDEARFETPDEFRPDRSPNPHIAFGHGVHACIGSALARLETRVALERFLDRFDDVQVVEDDPEPVWNSAMHGLQNLQVTFDA